MLLQLILKLKRKFLYFAPSSETTPLLRNQTRFEIRQRLIKRKFLMHTSFSTLYRNYKFQKLGDLIVRGKLRASQFESNTTPLK